MLWLWFFLPFVNAPYVEQSLLQERRLVPIKRERHLVPMKRHLAPTRRHSRFQVKPFWFMESY
jgi:hypothetical protein